MLYKTIFNQKAACKIEMCKIPDPGDAFYGWLFLQNIHKLKVQKKLFCITLLYETGGVNFINILRAGFTLEDPKSL